MVEPENSPSTTAKGISEAEKAQNGQATEVVELTPEEKPTNWPLRKKYKNHAVLSLATFSLTYSSSSFAPSIGGVIQHYGVSKEAALLTVALFVLGFGLGPFLAGPSTEVVGRRKVYIVTYASFTAWSWAAAYAPNFAALAVFRFLAGLSGSSSLSVHPASISDFTTFTQRNRFSCGYAFTAFGGASIAPLIGGFITTRASWHWNLIVTAILVTVSFLLIVVGVDESCAPVLKARKNHHIARHDGPSLAMRYKVALTQPFKLLFTELVLALVAAYLSILYAILYGFFAVFPIVYIEVRGWSQEGLALSYIALTLGFCAGTAVLHYGQDRAYMKIASQMPPGKNAPPSARFAMMFWFSWTVPVGIFLIAFCSYRNLHWFGDVLGMFMFSMGTLIVFTALIPFTIDVYLPQASSAVAATTAARALLACGFPLFSTQMYHSLGVPGASCLLAGIAVVLTPMPWVFNHYGDRLWGHKT